MSKVRKLILIMLILFLIITVGRIAYYLYYNVNLVCNFDKVGNAYKYSDAVENEAIDLNEISDLFTDIVALIGYKDFQETIETPVSIEYYKNIGDKHPIYVIKKGETIHFELFPKTKSKLKFCGNDSIPTNVKGWRLARPFKVHGEEKEMLLYVKLDDLICVTKEWLKENDSFANTCSIEVMSMGLLPTKRNVSKFILLFVDYKLYSEGIFLSMDMFEPIFANSTLICLFVIIILLGLYIMISKRF